MWFGARRSLLIALLCASAFAPDLRAGDYHDGATLDCSECHVVHLASRTDGGVVPLSWETDRASGLASLLKKDVNALCLSCHDDSPRATDVLGGNLGSAPRIVRQAGYLSMEGSVGHAAGGHTLGSRATAPGSDPPWDAELENGPGGGLNCINCHAQHGSRGLSAPTYRNLRPDPGNLSGEDGLVSYNHDAPGVNDPSRDVFVRRPRDYDEAAVDFNEPDPGDSAIGRFCSGCHDAFHGRPGDSESVGGRPVGGAWSSFLRHPTAGVDIGARGGPWSSRERFVGHRSRVKVQSGTGSWDPPGEDASPTCITCHRAHGNGNPFGLIFRSGRGSPTENGDTRGEALEDLCGQCHTQGAAAALP